MKKIILNVFTFVLLLSFMASPVLADRPARGAEKTPEIKPALTARNQDPPSLAVSETGLYIVQLDDASLTTYMGGTPACGTRKSDWRQQTRHNRTSKPGL